MCLFQLKMSRCNPRYLIDVSLGSQVIWVFSIEISGMLRRNQQSENISLKRELNVLRIKYGGCGV